MVFYVINLRNGNVSIPKTNQASVITYLGSVFSVGTTGSGGVSLVASSAIFS